MKTLVVPTDMSPDTDFAIDYAVNFAAIIDAEIILVNVYHPTPISVDGVTIVDAELQVKARETFDTFFENCQQRFAPYQVALNKKFLVGFAVDKVIDFADDAGAYMIVMATTGSNNMKRWFGSISTEVMKKSEIPVLLVPPNTSFKLIKKMVYADDFSKSHDKGMSYLEQMTEEFLADLYCLHVTTDQQEDQSWVEITNLEQRFKGIKIKKVELEESSVVSGLMNFNQKNDIDLLIMPSAKKGWIHSLFHTSMTREMAIKSKTPLLIIH